jgi:GDPmannose 4,6-dehydratase
MPKVALITGKGMDARVLTEFLLAKDYHVYIAARRSTNFEFSQFTCYFDHFLKKYPKSKLSTIYIDLSDGFSIESGLKSILEKNQIDEIYHLGASSNVGFSYDTPLLNVNTNGMSSFHILETLRKVSPKTRYYFASTTEMYAGGVNDEKYTETSKLHPKTAYGISKCLGFYWTQYFRETYGLFALSGILANHSCQYRHPSFFIKKITQAAAKIALGQQKSCIIGHLNWARDEMWADHAMEAAYQLLQLDKPQDMVIGNGDTKWGEEYVQLAFDYFNLKWQDHIEYDAKFLRKNEVVKLEVNPALAIEKIGWKCNRLPFKTHIELMCDWDYKVESGLNPIRPNIFEIYP